ncbi:hypothetical protein PSCLAVI8L_50071 [Pseudoclavibacter sp. 8L]|nr:hypothetical protein PSCLAVI8L_50071 [Pseudoclavibacter sp. 8L]
MLKCPSGLWIDSLNREPQSMRSEKVIHHPLECRWSFVDFGHAATRQTRGVRGRGEPGSGSGV